MQFKHSRVGLYSVVQPVICEDEILKAEALKSEVVSLIEMGRNYVVADLTDLGYISSEIIGALVSLHKITVRLPGEFVVVVSNENLIEILRRTGVTEVLSLVHNVKELQAKSTSLEATHKASPSPVRKSEFDLLKQELAGVGECEPAPKVFDIPLTIETVEEAPVAKDETPAAKKETALEDVNFSDALEEGLLSFETEMEPEVPAPQPPPAATTIKQEPPQTKTAPVEKAPTLAEILASESKEPPQEPEQPVQPPTAQAPAPVLDLEIRAEKPTPPPLRPQTPLAGRSAMSPLAPVSRQTKTSAQIVLQAPVYRSTRKPDRPVVSKKKETGGKDGKNAAKPVIIFVSTVLACIVAAFGIYKLFSHVSGIKSGINNVVSTVQSQESSLAQVEKTVKSAAPAPDVQQVVEEVTTPAKVEEPTVTPEVKAPDIDKRSKARPSQPKATTKAETRPAPKSAPVVERQKGPEPVREPVKEAVSAGMGSIFFSTNPAVAEIYLNGQKIGSTNVSTLDLPVGDVTLVFKKGGISLTRKVTIKPGKNESQHFYLNESAAPAAASAYTPATEPATQDRQVVASQPEPTMPAQVEAPAPPPPKPTAKPALTPARPAAKPTGLGKVFIVSMPQMADIYKDGKKIGKANESNLTFPVGPVTLTLKKGKLTKTQTIMVKEGENDPVKFQMD